TARETSARARAEAKERASGALLALRGEKVRKGRRWPIAVACLLAGAAAGAVAGMSRQPKPTTPPYTPTPTPTPFPQSAQATGGSETSTTAKPTSPPGAG